MYSDPIADYLTRIRNANNAGHKVVNIPASNLKKDMTKILYDQGYILSYKFEETKNNNILRYYGIGAQIIKDLNIKNMILVSRSKKKIIGLDGFGI